MRRGWGRCWAARACAGELPPAAASSAILPLVATTTVRGLISAVTSCCPFDPPLSFSAVVEDSVFKAVNLEEGGGLTCSLSNQILAQLKQ